MRPAKCRIPRCRAAGTWRLAIQIRPETGDGVAEAALSSCVCPNHRKLLNTANVLDAEVWAQVVRSCSKAGLYHPDRQRAQLVFVPLN